MMMKRRKKKKMKKNTNKQLVVKIRKRKNKPQHMVDISLTKQVFILRNSSDLSFLPALVLNDVESLVLLLLLILKTIPLAYICF